MNRGEGCVSGKGDQGQRQLNRVAAGLFHIFLALGMDGRVSLRVIRLPNGSFAREPCALFEALGCRLSRCVTNRLSFRLALRHSDSPISARNTPLWAIVARIWAEKSVGGSISKSGNTRRLPKRASSLSRIRPAMS